jgi:hypothetical protein
MNQTDRTALGGEERDKLAAGYVAQRGGRRTGRWTGRRAAPTTRPPLARRAATGMLLACVALAACGCRHERAASHAPAASQLAPGAQEPAALAEASMQEFRAYVIGDTGSAPLPQRDPFARGAAPTTGAAAPSPARPAPAAARPAPLQLQGLLERDGVWVALIDGQRVRTGDALGEWQVKRIDAAGVTLQHGALRRRLGL